MPGIVWRVETSSIASSVIHRQESMTNLGYSAFVEQHMRRIMLGRESFSRALRIIRLLGIVCSSFPAWRYLHHSLVGVASAC